jgi:hypothetical protein
MSTSAAAVLLVALVRVDERELRPGHTRRARSPRRKARPQMSRDVLDGAARERFEELFS